MLTNLKALIVVLVLSAITFHIAKPFVVRFSDAREFSRRRNVWIVLTIAGFLSSSFWLFTLLAIPLLAWAGRKDSNPVALYMLLLHVIPPISVQIPAIGVNNLFSLNMYRMLSFCVLIPTAWHLRKYKHKDISRFGWMDVLLLGYGGLQVLLFVRPDIPNAGALHDSATNVLRRAFLFFVDIYVLYFVVSRSCSSRKSIVDVMAMFCLASVVMAPLAVFESVRHWLLYAEVGKGWGEEVVHYIERAGVIRAAVSSGNPLALGYLLAIAFGLWLYLRFHVRSAWARIGVAALLLLGQIAAYSRGPWVGAVLIYFSFVVSGPRALSRVVKGGLIATLVCGALLLSPIGDRFTKVIPFLGGQVGAYNIDYREQLAERSLELIRENPLLGDQNAYWKLEDLRQGVGVIDFVNTYADIAVFYGLLGLFFFVSFILVGLSRVYRSAIRMKSSNPDLALLGISLVACIVGTLFMIYTSSFIFGYEKMFYVLAGLAAAYAHLNAVSRKTGAKVPSEAFNYPHVLKRAGGGVRHR